MVSGETLPGLVWAMYFAWEPQYAHNTVCLHWSSELSWDPEKTTCLSMAIFPSLLQSLIRQWFSSELVSWNGRIWDLLIRASGDKKVDLADRPFPTHIPDAVLAPQDPACRVIWLSLLQSTFWFTGHVCRCDSIGISLQSCEVEGWVFHFPDEKSSVRTGSKSMVRWHN